MTAIQEYDYKYHYLTRGIKMKKHFWLNFFLVLVGIVLGAVAVDLTSGIPALNWLSFGLNFGTKSPFTLDLNALSLTFGISLRITVSTIIFVSLSLLLGKLIVKK